MRARIATAIAIALAFAGLVVSTPSGAQQIAGRMQFAPGGAIVGTRVLARATGLAPNARFALVWRSGDPHWRTAAGKFYGIVASESAQTLAHAESDGGGALSVTFVVPEDFGFVHNVELRAESSALDALPAATQGFTVVPHLALANHAGPPGAPIDITATGLGYRFYQVVWHLLYDGAQTGWLSGVTTHGTAHVTIPASGTIGMHTLQLIEGQASPYLNGQQSPNAQRYIPIVIADAYRVTAGTAVRPVPARAQTPAREPAVAARDAAQPALTIDYASGAVGTPIAVTGSGFAAQAPVVLTWETYVGNRLSGNGWSTAEHPLATIAADRFGSFAYHLATPDDLGGPHRIIARAGASIEASAPYTIVPSVVEIEPRSVAPGAEFTIHIKGVGWTETANTYTFVLDNGHLGYGCGFNSQGDVTVSLRAPGRAGLHFIDLYPTIYGGETSDPGSPAAGSVAANYFLLPMLNVIDHPAERLPAFHLAFTVS